MTRDTPTVGSVADEEAGLVAWFLQLTPAQRLAELQSRVDFLSARGDFAHEAAQLWRESG